MSLWGKSFEKRYSEMGGRVKELLQEVIYTPILP